MDLVFDKIAPLFFPSLCLGCGSDTSKDGKSLCLKCRDSLLKEKGQIEISPWPEMDWIFHGREFRGLWRDLILKYKFHGKEYLGKVLVDISFDQVMLPLKEFKALVPIPMSPIKKIFRGFDHADRLARYLSPLLKIPNESCLLRRRWFHRTQVGLNKVQRAVNAPKGYELRRGGEKSLPSTVLLVDDILTTGATLRACARLLKKKGIQKVAALVLAKDVI